ncbi:hypothetical protein [Streptomyces sp. NPDC015125]|uniref:hypothetical protein n=1 Tax=Streptomyces sp. NPDC015125 TaxID=3364938 RepID=UPI0036FBE4CE
MTGYRVDPERTAKALADGCCRLGDIGFHDSEGRLTCIGRAGDVCKASTGGISFHLQVPALTT